MRFKTGQVVSLNNKTISVKVSFFRPHKKYKKMIRLSSTFYAHIDDINLISLGDFVKIKEVKPISKTKNWLFIEKV